MYEAIGFRDKLEAVDEGIRRYFLHIFPVQLSRADGSNAEFIDELIADPVFADMLSTDEGEDGGHGHSHVHSHGHGHSHGHDHEHSHAHDAHASASTPPAEKDKAARQADMNLAQDKIRSTLRSFVRDWSVEGQVERDACYTPILSALEGYFDADVDRAGKKVLVPGTGLGRLAMEIAAKGEPCPLSRSPRADLSPASLTRRLLGAGKRVLDLHAHRLKLHPEPDVPALRTRDLPVPPLLLEPPLDGKPPAAEGPRTRHRARRGSRGERGRVQPGRRGL